MEQIIQRKGQPYVRRELPGQAVQVVRASTVVAGYSAEAETWVGRHEVLRGEEAWSAKRSTVWRYADERMGESLIFIEDRDYSLEAARRNRRRLDETIRRIAPGLCLKELEPSPP